MDAENKPCGLNGRNLRLFTPYISLCVVFALQGAGIIDGCVKKGCYQHFFYSINMNAITCFSTGIMYSASIIIRFLF